MIELTLPFPPTVNTYWRHVGHKVLLSKKGREYRRAATAAVHLLRPDSIRRALALTGDVEVCITAHPPDKRLRDLDNLLKAPLDALAHAGVYDDDSQIVRLSIEWPNAQPENVVRVTLGDPKPPTR